MSSESLDSLNWPLQREGDYDMDGNEYKSIRPFEGMFAQSDFWDDLPEFIESYWHFR